MSHAAEPTLARIYSGNCRQFRRPRCFILAENGISENIEVSVLLCASTQTSRRLKSRPREWRSRRYVDESALPGGESLGRSPEIKETMERVMGI